MMWIAVLIAGLGSYALRAVPLILGARLRVPQRTQDVLRHAGMGGITALLVTSIAAIGTQAAQPMLCRPLPQLPSPP